MSSLKLNRLNIVLQNEIRGQLANVIKHNDELVQTIMEIGCIKDLEKWIDVNFIDAVYGLSDVLNELEKTIKRYDENPQMFNHIEPFITITMNGTDAEIPLLANEFQDITEFLKDLMLRMMEY